MFTYNFFATYLNNAPPRPDPDVGCIVVLRPR